MPHHFRTIEAFVQLLEKERAESVALSNDMKRTDFIRAANAGMELAYWKVLDILRASNIGIVYPPPEQETGEHVHNWIPVNLHPFCVCSTCRMLRPKTGAELLLSGPWHEPNGTRCPDCGMPADPLTGEHTCSDGQLRGFRASPDAT